MNNFQPFGTPPPETIILRLYSESDSTKREKLLQRLGAIFPSMNWRGHVYIVDDDPVGQIQRASEVIKTVADFLNGQKLMTIYVHPFIRLRSFGLSESEEWDRLLAQMRPFQREAYDQQSEVRMLILPIIKPAHGESGENILSIGDFFRARLAKPSFHFHGQSPLDPKTVLEKDIRVYVDEAEPTVESIITQLRINHVFESILEKVEADQADLLIPCRRHLVFDEKDDAVSPCFFRWENDGAMDSLELPAHIDCHYCISHSCLSMGENLRANGKEEEGRQVFIRLAIALSRENHHQHALKHAGKALELSTNDAGKAAALLHKGLCHLNLRELTQSEEALKEGSGYSNDPGLFSYHRGNVHFARQNYVEAIDRFMEALAAQSSHVPNDDLLLNLATCYINLEEFHQARQYFDRMEQISAPVRFHQGICDLGEGLVEPALRTFREALALSPAGEDISRVYFYIGNCLKELGRYDEAIDELGKAVEADPADYMNYNLLGFCLYQVKNHKKAIDVFHRAIEINPGSAIDYASIGSNLRELGRYEDAIAMYHMALSLDSTLTFAKENIDRLKGILDKPSGK